MDLHKVLLGERVESVLDLVTLREALVRGGHAVAHTLPPVPVHPEHSGTLLGAAETPRCSSMRHVANLSSCS